VISERAHFESLYRAHAGGVRANAIRRADAATAGDVAADVFLVVWRRLDRVPDDPVPWLLSVARKVLANKRRGESRSAALRERLLTDARSRTPAPAVERDDAVFQALAILSERDREALLLTAWEGLDTPQAAAVLGVKPGTFAVRLHRARQRSSTRSTRPEWTEPPPSGHKKSRRHDPRGRDRAPAPRQPGAAADAATADRAAPRAPRRLPEYTSSSVAAAPRISQRLRRTGARDSARGRRIGSGTPWPAPRAHQRLLRDSAGRDDPA